MATIPDEDEQPQATVERVARAVAAPIERTPPVLAGLAVAAGAGSLAPDPFGVIVAAVLIPVAWSLAKRR
jgi:hypothetical protein